MCCARLSQSCADALLHPSRPPLLLYHTSSTFFTHTKRPALSLHHTGGNPTSRYNWQQNVDNRASDWFFTSIPYPSATPGEYADTFVAASKAGGAQPMLTVPLLPYVAKAGPGRNQVRPPSLSLAASCAHSSNHALHAESTVLPALYSQYNVDLTSWLGIQGLECPALLQVFTCHLLQKLGDQQ